MPLQIRPATPADVPQILAFIRELALYEREPDAVLATESDLLRDGFGPTPRFRCVIAELEAIPAGFAPTAPGEGTTASVSKTSTSRPPTAAGESAKPSCAT